MHEHSDLRAVLAHRFPMLLVDAIVSLTPWDEIVGRKAITGSDFCYAGVPDGADRRAFAYPASLVMESFGQTAGVLINERRRHRGAPTDVVMLAAGITRVAFFEEAYPGDVLEHHARIDNDFDDFALISGEVRVGPRRLAEVEGMIVAYRPAHTIGRTNGAGGA